MCERLENVWVLYVIENGYFWVNCGLNLIYCIVCCLMGLGYVVWIRKFVYGKGDLVGMKI